MSSTSLLLPTYGISCKGGSDSSQSSIRSAASRAPSSSGSSSYGPPSPVDYQEFSPAASCQNLFNSTYSQASSPIESYYGPLEPIDYRRTLSTAITSGQLLTVAHHTTANAVAPKGLVQPVAQQGTTGGVTSQSRLLPAKYKANSCATPSQAVLEPVSFQAHSVKAKTHNELGAVSRTACVEMQCPQEQGGEMPSGSSKGMIDKDAWRDWVLPSRVPSLFEAGDEPTLIPTPKVNFDLDAKMALDREKAAINPTSKRLDAWDVPKKQPSDVHYLPATSYVPVKARPAIQAISQVKEIKEIVQVAGTSKIVAPGKPKQKQPSADMAFDRSVRESNAVFEIVWTNHAAKEALLKKQTTSELFSQPASAPLTEHRIPTGETGLASKPDIVASAPKLRPVRQKAWSSEPVKADLTGYGMSMPFLRRKSLPVQALKLEQAKHITTNNEVSEMKCEPSATGYKLKSDHRVSGLASQCKVFLRSDARSHEQKIIQSPGKRHVRARKTRAPLRLEKALPSLPVEEAVGAGGDYSDTASQKQQYFTQTARAVSNQTELANKGGADESKVRRVSDEGVEIIKQALGLKERPNLGSWMERHIGRVACF